MDAIWRTDDQRRVLTLTLCFLADLRRLMPSPDTDRAWGRLRLPDSEVATPGTRHPIPRDLSVLHPPGPRRRSYMGLSLSNASPGIPGLPCHLWDPGPPLPRWGFVGCCTHLCSPVLLPLVDASPELLTWRAKLVPLLPWNLFQGLDNIIVLRNCMHSCDLPALEMCAITTC